jgi:hypothetical protein
VEPSNLGWSKVVPQPSQPSWTLINSDSCRYLRFNPSLFNLYGLASSLQIMIDDFFVTDFLYVFLPFDT